MAVISRVTTWSDGQTLTASALNGEFNGILNDYNGNITNANISNSAAISLSKLASTPATLTGTETLTNKRITKRVFSEASNATPTPNIDSYDVHEITALAAGATFGAPTGTPTDGQPLIVRIKDNGSARSLAFNAIYRFSADLAAPTTTVISKTMYLGFIYNSADTKYDCIAQLNNF